MGPHGIVVTTPAFDYDLGLVERVEYFAIEPQNRALGGDNG